MYLLERIDAWSERHHPKWLDLLRVTLGMILLAKGIFFIDHAQQVVLVLQSTRFEFYAITIAHFAIGTTMICGLLIAIGLLTRPAVMMELPIVVAALALSGYTEGFISSSSESELAILTIVLLGIFLVEGSGKFSVDEYLNRHPEE